MEANIYDIKMVARYIALSLLTKQMTVSPLKLQKLLYYAQAWSMVFFGRQRQLFADVPQAWVNGPVYPTICGRIEICVSILHQQILKQQRMLWMKLSARLLSN